MLCGTFMNPAPIPSLWHRCAVRGNHRLQVCGIPVPLNGASAGVQRGKWRHVGSEAPRLPSVLAAHRHRKRHAPFPPLIRNAYSNPKHVRKAMAVKDYHCNEELLLVLYRITVICRCFGVPVPGGVAAVTGGTDSENRQHTNRANTIIFRPVSESWIASFSFDFKAPPGRAASALCKAERSESIIDKHVAVGAFSRCRKGYQAFPLPVIELNRCEPACPQRRNCCLHLY